MPVKTIHFDESGYTGPALLDPAQPFFCVSSSDIEEQHASELLSRSFPRFRGKEFKFKALWRRRTNREGLLRFAQEIASNKDSVFVWMIDKKFCVLTKLIDFLVEPLVHEQGFDFYANGYAPRFVNHFHAGIEFFGTPELYDATLSTYDDFVRSPSALTLARMQRRYALMATSVPEELRFYYKLAARGALRFDDFNEMSTFGSTNEIQLTSVLASVGYWRQRFTEDFEIFHDASSNFFGQAAVWDAITRDDVPHQMHPVADGSFVEFPLRVRRTVSCDSKDHRSIQLCDLLAGLFTKTARTGTGDADRPFISDLLDAGLGEIKYNGIRPELKFPDGSPVRATEPDPVDRMVEIMRPAL